MKIWSGWKLFHSKTKGKQPNYQNKCWHCVVQQSTDKLKLNCFFVFQLMVQFKRAFIISALINWTFSFASGWKPSGPTNPKQSAVDKLGMYHLLDLSTLPFYMFSFQMYILTTLLTVCWGLHTLGSATANKATSLPDTLSEVPTFQLHTVPMSRQKYPILLPLTRLKYDSLSCQNYMVFFTAAKKKSGRLVKNVGFCCCWEISWHLTDSVVSVAEHFQMFQTVSWAAISAVTPPLCYHQLLHLLASYQLWHVL